MFHNKNLLIILLLACSCLISGNLNIFLVNFYKFLCLQFFLFAAGADKNNSKERVFCLLSAVNASLFNSVLLFVLFISFLLHHFVVGAS